MKIITLAIDPGQKPQRLDLYLVNKINDLSRSKAQELIAAGLVKQSGSVVKRASQKTLAGSSLEVTMPTRTQVELIPQQIDLDIIYEDENLLAINKPAHLVVHPAFGNWDGTLCNAVLGYLANNNDQSNTQVNKPQIGIVHRLDKDTSGIILVAKKTTAMSFLQKQFKRRTVKKTYLALIKGSISPLQGSIEAPLGRDPKDRKKIAVTAEGKPALSHYQCRQYYQDPQKPDQTYSLIEVQPQTGRTHQIRVHLSSIGYPIMGDSTYGKPHPNLSRQFLHAKSLLINLPDNPAQLFEAPLAPDLQDFLSALKPLP